MSDLYRDYSVEFISLDTAQNEGAAAKLKRTTTTLTDALDELLATVMDYSNSSISLFNIHRVGRTSPSSFVEYPAINSRATALSACVDYDEIFLPVLRLLVLPPPPLFCLFLRHCNSYLSALLCRLFFLMPWDVVFLSFR